MIAIFKILIVKYVGGKMIIGRFRFLGLMYD